MLRFARWFATNAFCVGIAIGLVVNVGLLPLVSAQRAALADPIDPCQAAPPPPAPTPDEQNAAAAFWSLFSNTLFGPFSVPRSSYMLDHAFVPGDTNASATDGLGNAMLILIEPTPTWSTLQCQDRVIDSAQLIATVRGPLGEMRVAGAIITYRDAQREAESAFVPGARLPSLSGLLFDGNPRGTRYGEPFNPYTKTLDELLALIACEDTVRAVAQNATNAAIQDAAIAEIAASAAFVLAIALCITLAGTPAPPISQILGGACALAATASYIFNSTVIAATLSIRLALIANKLAADLARCQALYGGGPSAGGPGGPGGGGGSPGTRGYDE